MSAENDCVDGSNTLDTLLPPSGDLHKPGIPGEGKVKARRIPSVRWLRTLLQTDTRIAHDIDGHIGTRMQNPIRS